MPDDGQCKRYLFEYRYDGAEWRLEIPARSKAEAIERLKAMPWARYQGEIAMTIHIPSNPLSGLWKRIRGCFAKAST